MSRAREPACVLAAAAVAAVALTWPLARHVGSVGRVDVADGQFSIWNVAWVARTLAVDPLHVFDANIFYPHRSTLAYSESNLGAGALAVPAYWLSRGNPYVAHNTVVLLAFVLSAAGMYYLVRHLLARDRRPRLPERSGAAAAALAFAFCPYIFARTAHIQLMMTAGLPLAMLALHRVVERPTMRRGAALGAAMAAEAACCGYYGVFVVLMVGFAIATLATAERAWRAAQLWVAIAIAAAVAVVIVGPLFLPYARLHRVEGFGRPLGDAVRYSADWRAYLASSAYAHAWMLPLLGHWNEVLFPGFAATAFAVVGIAAAQRAGRADVVWLYGGLALLALWASFGPGAGLYAVLYRAVPLFAWLRAPARFGLVVAFALAVLAGHGVAAVVERMRSRLAACAIVLLTAAELAVPLNFPRVERLSQGYRVLASAPRGPVIEMPFFYPEVGLFQHTRYMLASTSHWMPLVNGYSDFIPPDFLAHVHTLSAFPSRDAFRILEPNRVRYAMFHMYGYNDVNRQQVLDRLKEFERYMRPMYVDAETRLYEIVDYPK